MKPERRHGLVPSLELERMRGLGHVLEQRNGRGLTPLLELAVRHCLGLLELEGGVGLALSWSRREE